MAIQCVLPSISLTNPSPLLRTVKILHHNTIGRHQHSWMLYVYSSAVNNCRGKTLEASSRAGPDS